MISIENENLANYVMFKLDKIDNSFTEEELLSITSVVIDYELDGESIINELSNLKGLESITIRNAYIYNDDYKLFLSFNNLKEITFEKCEFENADLISSLNLKSLSIINSSVNNYKFIDIISSLESLTLINANIDTSIINKLKELKYLQVSYSTLNINEEINLPNITELYIDNTNVNNFEFINNMKNIKRISIDENMYNNNKTLFDSYIEKGIHIYNENMGEFGGN